MFHLIHIISGSFDISDSESDQSGKTTESINENESEPEETNPLMRLHVMSEKSNWKNESHGQEEIKDEEEKSSKLIHWISLLLLRIKLQYNLSNTLFTVLLNLIYFILFVLRHPLHLLFPKTISELELIANLKVLNKTKIFAVCPNPKFACLYSIDEISCKVNGKLKAEICKKKLWRKRCNTELSFQKKLSFGRTKMVPYKTYPFLPPSEWIRTFYKEEQFLRLIRDRPEPSKTEYRDIWDGKILQQFLMDPDDMTKLLLKDKMNLALLLYLDFFNPFQRAVYSCGAIYMSVLNIPKGKRFKARWSMLIGLIPDPSEPEGHINTYLSPIIDDLIALYSGIQINSLGPRKIFSRSILLPILADLPSSRKMSQYKSHKADLPCDKCCFRAVREKGKIGASGKMSFYSDSNKSFPPRTDKEVRKAMNTYRKATNKTTAQTLSQKSGVKYSELVRLPYFDMVQNFLIDPMHNILMGLVSDIGEVLISNSNEMLTDKEIEILASRLSALRVPYDVGRLPKTMLEKLSARGLKAQQWKNFIVTYARVCLWNIVPYTFYDTTKCLAEAVELMLKDPIMRHEVETISCLLQKHHKLYARVLGKYAVSVNYHMALHIPALIQNWGPPTSWWCFPYERHIGLLGDTNASGKTVEEEIFRNFVVQHLISASKVPTLDGFQEKYIPSQLKPFIDQSLDDHCAEIQEEWSVYLRIQAERVFNGTDCIYKLAPSRAQGKLETQLRVEREDFAEETAQQWRVQMLPPQRIKQRPKLEFFTELKNYLSDIYEDSLLSVEPRIDTFARCDVNGSTFSSAYNRTDRGQTALVYCVDKLDGSDSEEVSPCYVQVNFFFTARVHLQGFNGATSMKVHHLANVNWFHFVNKNHAPDKLAGWPALKSTFHRGDHIVNVRRLIRRVTILQVKKNYQLVANLSR